MFYVNKAKQEREEYLKCSTSVYTVIYIIKLLTSKITLIKEDRKWFIFLTSFSILICMLNLIFSENFSDFFLTKDYFKVLMVEQNRTFKITSFARKKGVYCLN